MSNKINIENIDKLSLLKELWSNGSPAYFFQLHTFIEPPSFNYEIANNSLNKYIDYFCGRLIKMDLSGNEVDPFLYDEKYGSGTVQKIVNKLRNNSDQ